MTSPEGRAPAPDAATDAVEVVEILGFGRSGSTLLERLLAGALGVPGAGELVAVWRRGLLEDRHCSCGQRFAGCPFWQAVVATQPRELTRLRAAEMTLQTNRIMRVWSPRRVRHAAARRSLVGALPASWYTSMGALYRGFAQVSGATRFVDSSKAPVLGYLLAQVPGVTVRPVPLVRDPRAVAWAWGHPGPSVALAPPLPQLSPARAAIVWSLVLQAAETVAATLGGGVEVVRYEDLVAAPEATVDGIRRALSLPSAAGGSADGALAPVGHTMSGNPRLRFASGPVTVTPDERWRAGTAVGSWAAVTALTLPGIVRHGYPVRPGGERSR